MKLTATVKAFTARLYRAWQKAWLRARLDSYTRHLHAIAAQRENDFHAERMLHRAVSATRAKLASL
jgi:alkylhydroperoxidase/carboxymuconolactone decarboxylase family protein YurZ